jgi:hypothetical protein
VGFEAMLTVGAIKRCQVLQTLTGCAAATFGGRPGQRDIIAQQPGRKLI